MDYGSCPRKRSGRDQRSIQETGEQRIITIIYRNSNISPCKNIIFQKNPPNETKILQDITTLLTNLKFQHEPKYQVSKILISK
jgi:hypothetical protein